MNRGTYKILLEGLENGANALRMMLGASTKLRNVDYYIPKNNNGEIQYADTGDMNVHLLRTEIVGNFKGVSYLMLKTIDVYKIHKKCLPAKVFENDTPKNRGLKGAVLLELDNIVSAAVITTMANHIETTIYGDVPKLKVIKGKDVNAYITGEFQKYAPSINVRAALYIDDLDMELEFIWILEEAFFVALTTENGILES